MALLRLRTRSLRINIRHVSSLVTQNNEESTTVPQYPPILDITYEARKERQKQAEYEEIKAVKTVEEKQIKLNMPKYYGFKTCILKEDVVPYNSLPLTQHITRTHLIEAEKLPDCYNELNVDNIVESVKGLVEERVSLEIDGYRRNKDLKVAELDKVEAENLVSASISKQINRILVNNLQRGCKHLAEVSVDYEPRIEAHWIAGGMDPTERHRKMLEGREFTKPRANDPIDRHFHYYGKPVLTLRHELPLKPIIPHYEANNSDFSVPYFKYDPRSIGTFIEHVRSANIPGFWANDKNHFGLISYHNCGHLMNTSYAMTEQDYRNGINRQAILASYGWLFGQANILGFNTYNDLTYPLVTQTVITNGKKFAFYVYQLNTMLVHGKNTLNNPKSNICWALPETPLYEKVEEGKLFNFNVDVLKTLIKFYMYQPEERLGVNLRPYLSQEEKLVADYSDEDKRQWLEREYKFLMSNRSRFKLPYELYHWEKIYKVDQKTRPMDKKLRPFELQINPFNRKLNERQPFYIPRKLRPDLPRNKGRYHKEYFP